MRSILQQRSQMNIKEIVIQGSSGHCGPRYVYSDELKITSTTIAYECKPLMETCSAIVYRKWSYETTNVDFARTFEKIADAVCGILKLELDVMWLDCGSIDFTVIYEDGNKASRFFVCPSDVFEDCFRIIRQIIPSMEDVPETLTVREEDCDENG